MDDYDPIPRLKTPEDCEQFAINVEKLGKPELALRARRRAIELRAVALVRTPLQSGKLLRRCMPMSAF
jgi:hypothetical protein